MSLISIIVPVYNVAPYVRECLDSIIRQSYRHLEIIVVDDGSSDGCAEICDQYAQRDARVKVIHQPNKGLSAARNIGIDAAGGSFLGFADSDDILDTEFIERLYQGCIETNSDAAMCQFCSSPNHFGKKTGNWRCYDGYRMNLELCKDDSGAFGVVWNKLYQRRLFHDLRFPAGKTHEDEYITYKLLWKANSCAITDDILYFYRKRPNSIIHSGFSTKRLEAAIACEERSRFYLTYGAEELSVLAQAGYCHILRGYLRDINRSIDNPAYWNKKMITAYKHVLWSDKTGLKKKAALTLQMISPNLYKNVKGVWKCLTQH